LDPPLLIAVAAMEFGGARLPATGRAQGQRQKGPRPEMARHRIGTACLAPKVTQPATGVKLLQAGPRTKQINRKVIVAGEKQPLLGRSDWGGSAFERADLRSGPRRLLGPLPHRMPGASLPVRSSEGWGGRPAPRLPRRAGRSRALRFSRPRSGSAGSGR